MHAEVFDVDVAAQPGIEKQIPAGVVVIVVDVDAVTLPLPFTATVQIVGGHDPVGIVAQKDVASPEVHTACDENFAHVTIAAVRIRAAGTDAIMVVIPIAVIVAVAALVP